jgi:DNA-binding transcriptional LysR family regulator
MSMNWNDLRLFLAIAKERSLSAAARRLGTSQPTVSRRLARMEAEVGVKLLTHTGTGYDLTEAGADILISAETIAAEFDVIARRVQGRDRRLGGPVRLTCTESMAAYLAPEIARFAAEHPEIELTVISTLSALNLNRREADVALRSTAEPPETLMGRRLARAATGFYASTALAPQLRDRPATKWPWIGWSDENYMRRMVFRVFPDVPMRHWTDEMQTMRAMAGSGLGVAALPCYVGDADPALRRVAPPNLETGLNFWILYHPDIQRVARVRRFVEFVSACITADAGLFEGRRPRAD